MSTQPSKVAIACNNYWLYHLELLYCQGLTANSHSFNQELGKSIRPEAFPNCVVILAQLSESTQHKSRTTQNHARLSTFIHLSKSFVLYRYKKIYCWVIWFSTVRISPTCTEKHRWCIMKSLGNLISKNPQLKLYIKAPVWPCFQHFIESYFSCILGLGSSWF